MNKSVLSLKSKRGSLGLAALLGTLAFSYFVVTPKVAEYFHLREIAKLERVSEQADIKVQIALKEAAAQHDAYCSADAVKPVRAVRSKTDGGTKPNAAVTATIVADDGYFIYGPSITRSRTGTRSYKKQRYTTEAHEVSKGTAFSGTILAKASYRVWAGRRSTFGTSSVTATSNLSGVQIDENCLEYIFDKEKRALLASR